MPEHKQPLSNGGISFGIHKVILFTTGLLIIFIGDSLWAIHLQSLHCGIFLLSLFVSALLSLQWSMVLRKGFKNWQTERYQHPGEFIKPPANELGSANAFKRMSVWKAAGPCIELALKNETEILNRVKWTLCCAVESECERERPEEWRSKYEWEQVDVRGKLPGTLGVCFLKGQGKGAGFS